MSEFFQPVSSETSRKSRVDCSLGVTSFVTVLPPSFVRSFAIPPNICATETNAIASACDHSSRQPKSIPYETSCRHSPVTSVRWMPHRAPASPAARFVTTPASSYSVNISATCSALNDLAYACSSTIIRIAPSVTVKSRYEIEMTANGRSAFLGGSVDDDGLDGFASDAMPPLFCGSRFFAAASTSLLRQPLFLRQRRVAASRAKLPSAPRDDLASRARTSPAAKLPARRAAKWAS